MLLGNPPIPFSPQRHELATTLLCFHEGVIEILSGFDPGKRQVPPFLCLLLGMLQLSTLRKFLLQSLDPQIVFMNDYIKVTSLSFPHLGLPQLAFQFFNFVGELPLGSFQPGALMLRDCQPWMKHCDTIAGHQHRVQHGHPVPLGSLELVSEVGHLILQRKGILSVLPTELGQFIRKVSSLFFCLRGAWPTTLRWSSMQAPGAPRAAISEGPF
ncbi:hypothetical protein BSKO_10116 [Bryopsis sp. KO-2023]|nr:hypothetical protein BSKO_10116 [Bryopsis sp. KO-2023]